MVDVNLKVPAFEKLLDYVASGIGAVGGPMLARWKARADTDAMRISAQGKADSISLIAKAQAEARDNFAGEEPSTRVELSVDREIRARLDFQEEKRQRNIGSVVGMAAEEVGDKAVENHDVDHDWVARFFADVQDVTSEKMQKVWSKILAGEVEAPGRTSLHTLAILKNMTQQDAELFENLSEFIFIKGLINEESFKTIPGYPNVESLIKLQSYVLVIMETGLSYNFNLESGEVIARNNNIAYKISRRSTTTKIQLPCVFMPSQGEELYSFTESVINDYYLRKIANFLKEKGDFKLEKVPILKKLSDGQVYAGSWELVSP